MASNYEEHQKLILDLENDCLDATELLVGVLNIFSLYQVQKLSGVDMVMKDSANPQNMIKPLDVSIVEIKTKIARVSKRYSRRFPDEMKYLDEGKIRDFKCLPCASIIGSSELKTSVNRTVRALGRKLTKIQKKKRELNKKAADTSARRSALAAFYEASNFRLLDSNTTEQEILLDYDRKQLEKDRQLKENYNASVKAEIKNVKGPFSKLWFILGVETVPAVNTRKAFNMFHEYQLSLQYPKSVRFCNQQREPLSSAAIQEARQEQSASSSDQAIEAAKQNDIYQTGYGATYVKSSSFELLDRRMKQLLASYGKISEKSKYTKIVTAIESSNKKSSVQVYIENIQNLRKELSQRRKSG